MRKYTPIDVESKWQKKWREEKISVTDLKDVKNKFYCLVELPYTSGVLHIGHWFTFTKGDILSRFKRMQGYNVIFPNGYDTFGLPAENAAIKNNMHPRAWTEQNITVMREQFERMGTVIDWEKSVATCDPSYYKWNQWIFLKMLERGIAYRGSTFSNWCPQCQTVLADENVEAGKCWRCHSEVQKKEIAQWFLKITDYADKLIWEEDASYDWPKYLKDAQNAWIGKSVGAEVKFKVEGADQEIKVFTTRIDTIYGATFLVVAPEHELLNQVQDEKVKEYIKIAQKRSEQERKENKEKSGVFTGLFAINPFNQEKIPVWVSDYVLLNYGTGAIMAVPAHDTRDNEFAKKFDLEIKEVIIPERVDKKNPPVEGKNAVERKNVHVVVKNKNGEVLCLRWKKFPWTTFPMGGVEVGEDLIEAAKREVLEETGYKNLVNGRVLGGEVKAEYFAAHKDENRISYTSLVIFDLENEEQDEVSQEEQDIHEAFWVSENKLSEDLLVHAELDIWLHRLRTSDMIYTDEGALINSGKYDGLKSSEAREKMLKDAVEKGFGEEKVNYHLHDWSISRQRYWGTPIPVIHCDDCGIVPVPEDQLPVQLPEEVDYTPSGDAPLSRATDWVNVTCPKCGKAAKRETETMDGFIDNSWYFYRYLDPKNEREIFDKELIKNWFPIEVYIGGSEHTYGHALYSRFFTKFFKDLGLVDHDEYTTKRVHHGVVLGPDGSRMSKSKGNVVDPDEQAKEFGADAVRVYLNFMGPYDIVAPWVPEGMHGSYRFIERVWNLLDKVGDVEVSQKDLVFLNKTIQKVTQDLEDLANNTAIATLMEYLNYLSKKEQISKDEYKTFLILLSPLAPHLTEELWEQLGESFSIHNQSWPTVDEKYLVEDQVNLAVQINGKMRSLVVVDSQALEDQAVDLALKDEKVKKYIESKDQLKKVIYVKGKILNLIV